MDRSTTFALEMAPSTHGERQDRSWVKTERAGAMWVFEHGKRIA